MYSPIFSFARIAISDKKTAVRIVTVLEEHGWLVRVQGGDFVNGIRRKDVWRIVKKC